MRARWVLGPCGFGGAASPRGGRLPSGGASNQGRWEGGLPPPPEEAKAEARAKRSFELKGRLGVRGRRGEL